MNVVELRHIKKTYHVGSHELVPLKDVNLSVSSGDAVGLFGSSGSGKSTLLHLIGGLDYADSGELSLLGKKVADYSDNELATLRNRSIGFVFQFFHLLTEFNALENVMLPVLISGASKEEATKKARGALDLVQLSHRLDHSPSQLSGGERQRLAIARAIVMKPQLLLADEPTGNLDTKTGFEVWECIMNIQRELGLSLIVASHNQELLAALPKKIEIKDGILLEHN